MRGRSLVMFGRQREVVRLVRMVREVGMVGGKSGQQGQAVALSERDGGAGQEEEGDLRVKYSQIGTVYHPQNKTLNPSNLCAAT